MKIGLDLSGVSTQSSRVVVPTGNYSMEVVSVELAETKAKNGHMLVNQYKILSGSFAGTVMTDRINIANPNEDAARIGQSVLKTILTVGGHKNPNKLEDTNEMIGLKFNAYIEENESSFTGKDGNEIETTENQFKSFFAYEEITVEVPPVILTEAPIEAAPAPLAAAPAPAVGPSTTAPVAPATTTAPPVAAAGAFPWQK